MIQIMNTVGSLAILAMAAVPLAAIPAMAHAASAPEAGVHIRVGDLNLSRPADASVFQARVEVAGRRFCAGYAPRMIVQPDCVRAIRDEAVSKLGAAQRLQFETATGATLQTVATR